MSPASTINVTINGRPVQARAGQTVMEAAAAAGIEIPSLCHHPAVRPEGACRVCLVEIEKQRNLQPACTFPVAEGMVVQTETEKVAAARKFSLQMIFSERTHYCMYCTASGSADSTDCELQKLGYRYGLNCWEFTPNYGTPWAMDASRHYFVMDHGRCILCRRCVRACDQVAANHTLGVQQRGARAMICADDDVPFGESSCISCGTCLQVCPTGALSDRFSAYLGHETEVKRTKATCMACPVGCGIEALTRDDHLVRVEGDWEASNGGLLCSEGRFEVLEPRADRILWPMVRSNGKLVQTSWDKALGIIARRFQEAHRVGGLASPHMTNEALAGFACFFHEVMQTNEVGLLYGDVPPLDLGAPATLQDVAKADCVVVIGDPLREQKVAGYLAKRAFDREARLIVVHDHPTDLDGMSSAKLHLEDISTGRTSPFERMHLTYHLRVDGLAQIKSAVDVSQRPVVMHGPGLSATVYAALRALPPKVKFLPLVKGANAIGASRLGFSTHPTHGDALFVLLGDDAVADTNALADRQFTVVQASYPSAWTAAADVVLPARLWSERRGHIVNIEGRKMPIVPLVKAPKSVHSYLETFLMLSIRMGYALSYEEISEIALAV